MGDESNMIDLNINELYTLDKEDIQIRLSDFEKDELIEFASSKEIPVKKYHSKNKIVEHLSREIASAGIFRRISGTDPKRERQ
jgi:hypothetical protein